ncbi:kelch-like protein 40a isoform X2 [Clavelina lepadiformis]
MFTVKMKESYLNEGIMKDVSGPTMASILDFMYTSNTILTHDNVYDVLEASEYFLIPTLIECCAKFFMKSMNGENCLKIRSYSNRYNMDDHVQAAETFISKNLRAVLKSFDFLQLNLDDVKALLKLENYEDLIDEGKFKSVADWTKYENDARRKHFYDLFQLIQLDYLSKTFLKDFVHAEKLVRDSVDCMNKLLTSLISRISVASASKEKSGMKEHCRKILKVFPNAVNFLKHQSYSKQNSTDYQSPGGANFLQFGVDDVMVMLQSKSDKKIHQDLVEEDKYKNAVAWTRHNLTERRKHFSDLFHLIQPNYLSMKFLIDVVHKEELIGQSTDCMSLLVTSLFSRIPELTYKKRKRQFDEILMIDGEDCPRSVVKFNTKTKQWSEMPDTNIARTRPSAVNYNQQILLMGGGKEWRGPSYNSVEMLDLNDENPKWDSNLPSMGEERYIFASTLLNGLVYCAGGYNDTGHLSSCESYNPEERKWSSIRNMYIKRTDHALVSARGLLYVLGGYVDDNNVTNTAECYDPLNGLWDYIPPMKTCRYGLTAVVLNNEIYAIGGIGISSVEKYNLDTKAWIDVPSMNEKRNGGSACVVDGLIWVFGG